MKKNDDKIFTDQLLDQIVLFYIITLLGFNFLKYLKKKNLKRK